MRVRPLHAFAVIATLLVSWLSVRMWSGGQPSAVWAVSCLLGAWAPLAAATIFAYVRRVGDHESGVAAAWLVRAIGMHCVLVWMVGASDWLAGPPGHRSGWNTDFGAPVVMFAFFPLFFLSLGVVEWTRSATHRLARVALRPALAHEITAGRDAAVPFRGVTMARAALAPVSRSAVLPIAIGVSACLFAALWPTPAPATLGTAALALAIATGRHPRAVAPSLASLVAVAACVLARLPVGDLSDVTRLGVAWPWCTLGSFAVYLGAIELRLFRGADVTGRSPSVLSIPD